MSLIDVFFTAEHVPQVGTIEADPSHSIEVVRAEIIRKHGGDAALFIFIEDADEPLEVSVTVEELAKHGPVKVHAHRCRHVEVTVNYGGHAFKKSFSPGATLSRIKKWAAEAAAITPGDAAELLLQIVGTKDRPLPSTHVGTLVKCPHCAIAFDLVSNIRIQG